MHMRQYGNNGSGVLMAPDDEPDADADAGVRASDGGVLVPGEVISGADTGLCLRALTDNSLGSVTLDMSRNWRPAREYQATAMTQALRLINSEHYFSSREARMLVRMLFKNPDPARRVTWYSDIRASRRRELLDLASTPVHAALTTTNELKVLLDHAQVTRIRALIDRRAMLLLDAFRAFNSSRTGALSVEELYGAVTWLGLELTPDRVRHLFAQFDADQDGRISLREFCAVLHRAGEGVEALLEPAAPGAPRPAGKKSMSLVSTGATVSLVSGFGDESDSDDEDETVVAETDQFWADKAVAPLDDAPGATTWGPIPPRPLSTEAAKPKLSPHEFRMQLERSATKVHVKLSSCSSFKQVWTSKGSASRHKGSVWAPNLPRNKNTKAFVPLGHYVSQGYSKPSKQLRCGYLTLSDDSSWLGVFRSKHLYTLLPALCPHPIGYQQVWRNKTTTSDAAGQDFTVWRPLPPSKDFVAMGMVVTGGEEPELTAVCCVPKGWTTTAKTGAKLIWSDAGTCGKPGSLWCTNVLNTVHAVEGHSPPALALPDLSRESFRADWNLHLIDFEGESKQAAGAAFQALEILEQLMAGDFTGVQASTDAMMQIGAEARRPGLQGVTLDDMFSVSEEAIAEQMAKRTRVFSFQEKDEFAAMHRECTRKPWPGQTGSAESLASGSTYSPVGAGKASVYTTAWMPSATIMLTHPESSARMSPLDPAAPFAKLYVPPKVKRATNSRSYALPEAAEATRMAMPAHSVLLEQHAAPLSLAAPAPLTIPSASPAASQTVSSKASSAPLSGAAKLAHDKAARLEALRRELAEAEREALQAQIHAQRAQTGISARAHLDSDSEEEEPEPVPAPAPAPVPVKPQPQPEPEPEPVAAPARSDSPEIDVDLDMFAPSPAATKPSAAAADSLFPDAADAGLDFSSPIFSTPAAPAPATPARPARPAFVPKPTSKAPAAAPAAAATHDDDAFADLFSPSAPKPAAKTVLTPPKPAPRPSRPPPQAPSPAPKPAAASGSAETGWLDDFWTPSAKPAAASPAASTESRLRVIADSLRQLNARMQQLQQRALSHPAEKAALKQEALQLQKQRQTLLAEQQQLTGQAKAAPAATPAKPAPKPDLFSGVTVKAPSSSTSSAGDFDPFALVSSPAQPKAKSKAADFDPFAGL
jgi:hypothetical protein